MDSRLGKADRLEDRRDLCRREWEGRQGSEVMVIISDEKEMMWCSLWRASES